MADMLASPEDLAALLQQDLDRATAELLLECATAIVQGIVRQRLVKTTETITVYLDEFDEGPWFNLPERPVIEVDTISIGENLVTDWTPHYTRARVYRAGGWRSFYWNTSDKPTLVTVTYTHGYETTDQKLQLARSAVLSLAAQGYSNPSGATRESIDDYSVQYAEMSAQMAATPHLAEALRRQYTRTRNSVRLIKR